LFYDSVEQYERHQYCVTDNAIRAKFAAKQRAAMADEGLKIVERRRVAAIIN